MPVKMKHIWYAKTAVMAELFAISCLLILIVSFVEGILFKDTGYPLVSNLSMLAGTALMIITSLWQIPLCMFLGYKIGIFPTFIINLAAYIVFSATVSLSNWWMAVPYTYTARLLEFCPTDLWLNREVIPLHRNSFQRVFFCRELYYLYCCLP